MQFRPIVSCIGTPAYLLSRFLVSIFSIFYPISNFSVNNSIDFVKRLKVLNPIGHIMISFDVVSLFTNIPIVGALDCLLLKLREFHFSDIEVSQLIYLTRICISQSVFLFQGEFYNQTDGLAMGNPLSPILSEIYMSFFEINLLKCTNFISTWFRYVDDTFALVKQNTNIDDLISLMNSLDPRIQFTFEKETNNTITFLDVKIQKNHSEFSTTVFRKSFAVQLPPHSKSCHPLSQKMSAFYFYVCRALRVCSDESSLNIELNFLKSVAINRGYCPSIIDKAKLKLMSHKHKPKEPSNSNICILPYFPKLTTSISNILNQHSIHVVFRPFNKLNFTQLKDKIPVINRWGIYSIPCDCGRNYIGQTRRSLLIRCQEHRRYVKNQEFSKSSIAKHCWDCGHNCLFNEISLLKSVPTIFDLNFFESLYILKNQSNVINDLSAIPPLSKVWFKILKIDT